nr:hypothetical protein [Candidatus Sigynarchaeota archaeon]
MTVEVKQVKVICPVCQATTSIEIPVFLVNEAQDGVLKVQVPQGACCPKHSFMAFIDKKFTVRGYQNVDIEYSIPTKEQLLQKKKEEELKDYDVDDFITAVGQDIAPVMIRAIILGIPILMLDSADLRGRLDKINALFRDMETDDLFITLEKISREELKDKSKKNNTALVIAPLYGSVVRSPFRQGMVTRFESDLLREIVQNIPDRSSEIIFLRKEILKIRKMIDEFAAGLQNVNKFYEEDIPAFIMDKFNYKIDAKNIDVIKDLVDFKYGKNLAQKIINKSLDKIRTDLW